MLARHAVLVLAALGGSITPSPLSAQSPLPRTEAAINAWDVAIVRRAAAMLATPASWNRSDDGKCDRSAPTTTIRCALERAVDEQAGLAGPKVVQSASTAGATEPDCRLSAVGSHSEGSCGPFFDESTVFSIARAKAVVTGKWREDATPREVWSGLMVDAGAPALQQARRLVDSIAPRKYKNARLVEFNNDTSVTFATVQAYFHALEERVRLVTHDDLVSTSDDVEIELYSSGDGVIRTYNGWYAVSGWTATDSTMRFRVDTAKEVAPNALDREIIRRADALMSSDAVWNRADNRKCPADATTWSIYCALEKATRDVTGGFHHRRPALETVRVLVDERTKGRDYNHRLMDYNNDSTTHLSDVHSLFAAALAQMPKAR